MPTKFVFLVLPQVHLMDLAGPDQTIHEAIDFGADFEIAYCGIGEPVETSAGLGLKQQPHYSKVKLNEGDFLIIPGSNASYVTSAAFRQNKELFSWIKEQHRKKVNLVSICVGAFVLAECGLLDGIECTTHFQRSKQLQKQYPRALVKENQLYTDANGIYTSAGIASGIDLTLHIIEKISGGFFAHKVAREMVIYIRREGKSEQQSIYLQYRNHLHAGIHKAQDFIIENISRKNKLFELAETACMSERNFTRTFKKETGITVVNYINAIRKEMIEKLRQNKDISYGHLAAQIGLSSEKQVRRILHS